MMILINSSKIFSQAITAENLKVGMYVSFKEFTANTPSLEIKYNKEDDKNSNRVLIYLNRKEIWYFDQSKNDYFEYTEECWGYFNGEKFNVKDGRKFYTLEIMPLYSVYTSDREKKSYSTYKIGIKKVTTYTPVMGPNGIPTGGGFSTFLRPTIERKTTPMISYAIDMKSGELIELKIKNVAEIIKTDEELFLDFEQNDERKLILKSYVVEFNKRNGAI